MWDSHCPSVCFHLYHQYTNRRKVRRLNQCGILTVLSMLPFVSSVHKQEKGKETKSMWDSHCPHYAFVRLTRTHRRKIGRQKNSVL